MKKFERAHAPAVWAENETRWNQQWVARLKENPNARFSWYEHNRKTAREIALPHLKAQTTEHCSFCDGFPVDSTSPDTVEHFHPKCAGRFPEHAYTWTNLYYCCAACQTHKREQWDENLVAPDAADYTFARYFEFDFTTGEMRASSTADAADTRRAKTTIAMYGLDSPARRRSRRLELMMWTGMDRASRQLENFAHRDYLEGPTPTP